MELNWFFLGMTATLLWSIAAIILKFVRVKYIKSPMVYLIITAPINLIGLFLLFFGKLQIPSTRNLLLIMAVGVIGITAYWLYIAAIQKEEISRVVTLYNAVPLVTLVLATLFLKEVLSIKDYIAFPLIIIGSILISIKREEKRFTFSKSITLVFISVFLFGVQAIILKIIAKVDFISMLTLRWLTIFIFLSILFSVSKEIRKRAKQDLKQLNKKGILLMYTAELLGMTGFVFSYLAIQRGPVSLVSLIQGAESLFVIALAVLISIFIPKILKEEITKKTISLKIISALLIIAGLYLIVA